MEAMEFDSIEDAELELKRMTLENPKVKALTAHTIKLRANKYSSADRIIPKDNILCEWMDDSVIKYYRAKSAKRTGSAWEYKVRDALKRIGYTQVVTSRSESRTADNNNIDLVDTEGKLPINIQCKSYKRHPDYNAIRQGCNDIEKPFIIAWHCSQPDVYFDSRKEKNSKIPIEKDLMIVPADFFYELLNAYTKYNHIL